MVLTPPGLPSPPFQVSWRLGNYNLGLKPTLSSPVPHGKWLCPQRTEYTSVWLPTETWAVWGTASPGPAGLCSAWLRPQRASVLGTESVGTRQPPDSAGTNPITPQFSYKAMLFISYLGKQSVRLHSNCTEFLQMIER